MEKRQKNFFRYLWPLPVFLTVFISACLNDQQRLQDRPTVANFGTNSTPFADITPTGTAGAEEPKEERPTGQVFINKDFCSCLDKKADILNNCATFCASKDVKVPTLFGTVTLGPQIEQNPDLGNLFNWCKKEIKDGKTNPGCQLEAFDGSNTTMIDLNIPNGSNSFSADVSLLGKNITYVMKIVENGSGSNAKSTSFQIRRALIIDDVPSVGPLKITPVNQYFCVSRTFTTENNPFGGSPNEIFLKAVKRHFYFSAANQPPTLPPGDHRAFCHDVNLFGNDDGPLFPRLGLTEQIFNLWNETDIRFFDQNANQKLDVNELVSDRLAEEFGIKSEINIFSKFDWPNFPATNAQDTLPRLGYIMQPWTDAQTQKSYCPRKEHYNSSVPVFKVLKEVVGINTEGLYLAEKQPESFTDANGNVQAAPTDFILVREGLLKKVWFYIEKGLHIIPDDVSSTTKTILVYWPPDIVNPRIKKSTQKIYILKHPSQLSGLSNRTEFRTGITPSDKRFACIPSRD